MSDQDNNNNEQELRNTGMISSTLVRAVAESVYSGEYEIADLVKEMNSDEPNMLSFLYSVATRYDADYVGPAVDLPMDDVNFVRLQELVFADLLVTYLVMKTDQVMRREIIDKISEGMRQALDDFYASKEEFTKEEHLDFLKQARNQGRISSEDYLTLFRWAKSQREMFGRLGRRFLSVGSALSMLADIQKKERQAELLEKASAFASEMAGFEEEADGGTLDEQ